MRLKVDAIAYYGGKCAICGESHIEFLSIDHNFNDGNIRRKENTIGSGHVFYNWLKTNEYPDDLGLRVLCHNCNMSIGAYGYSPLQEDMNNKWNELLEEKCE